MAQAEFLPYPFFGSKRDVFREFELLLQTILAMAAFPANQQANFSNKHVRHAVLRFFQTLL